MIWYKDLNPALEIKIGRTMKKFVNFVEFSFLIDDIYLLNH